MKKTLIIAIAVICIIALLRIDFPLGKSVNPDTPGQDYVLTPEEFSSAIKNAKNGSAEDAYKLALNYEAKQAGSVESLRWLRESAKLGKNEAKVWLAHELLNTAPFPEEEFDNLVAEIERFDSQKANELKQSAESASSTKR